MERGRENLNEYNMYEITLDEIKLFLSSMDQLIRLSQLRAAAFDKTFHFFCNSACKKEVDCSFTLAKMK